MSPSQTAKGSNLAGQRGRESVLVGVASREQATEVLKLFLQRRGQDEERPSHPKAPGTCNCGYHGALRRVPLPQDTHSLNKRGLCRCDGVKALEMLSGLSGWSLNASVCTLIRGRQREVGCTRSRGWCADGVERNVKRCP